MTDETPARRKELLVVLRDGEIDDLQVCWAEMQRRCLGEDNVTMTAVMRASLKALRKELKL